MYRYATQTRRHFLDCIAKTTAGLAGGLLMNRTALTSDASSKPLNIVLILVDDLGWTDVGCYGSAFYETPNIDRLAQGGIRFTNGYAACTVCSPTRASIMTGTYPARLHITDWIPGHNRPFAKLRVPWIKNELPLDEVTIAERLKAAGYMTAHMGKWHLGGDPHYPDKHGFDLNIGGDHRGQPPSYFSPYKIPVLEDGPEGEYLPDRLGKEACSFIAANKEKPFFLYLPFYAVHTPIQAKKDLTQRYQAKIESGQLQNNAKYAAMIHSVDEAVGNILNQLDSLGLTDHTVIFFTGDNGGLIPITDNSPLRAGKGSEFEGGVRVPFIVRWPGVIQPGSICHEPVMSIDFFPTILDMVGLKEDVTHPVDGESIVPLLKYPQSSLQRNALYWHYPHYHPGGAVPYSAIREGDYKLIEYLEDRSVKLYNVKEDISESTDLSNRMPEKAADLRRKLADWRQSVNAQLPWPNPDYDPNR